MTNNLGAIKKHLTIIFSLIVFFIVFFLGFVFFSVKYIQTTTFENRSFENIVKNIDSGKIGLNDLLKTGGFKYEDKDVMRRMNSKNMKEIPVPKYFFNYLYLDSSNNVLFANIIDSFDLELVNGVIGNPDYEKNIVNKNGFLITKINFSQDEKLILLKKNEYNFFNYLNDIFGFLLISFIFSFIVYFIGNKFINKVLLPVEENIIDMKNFIHNAGHELKTPISVIDSNSQILIELDQNDKSMIKEIQNETKKLNGIINSLINLTEIGTVNNKQEVNLYNILEEIQSTFQNKIQEKNLKINFDVNKKIIIKANKDYAFMFLSNIFGNAIKYSKTDGIINIFYTNGKLLIEDNGYGIKKEDLPKIWDRFYKGDKSRSSEGFGIGLSIVKKISDIYSWKIKIESREGEGTKVKINF